MSDMLHGKKVFLSASVPPVHRPPGFSVNRVPVGPVEHITVDGEQVGWIEDAVIATVRAILGHGGRLVMGGHPSIVPLVAMVAGEHERAPNAEFYRRVLDDFNRESHSSLVEVFQSRAYEQFLPADTWAMCEAGLADIHWTEAQNGERFDPSEFGQPQCRKSLNAMREILLTRARPTAMVGIGGMQGLHEEIDMFLEMCSGSVFLFQSTGGMAGFLADNILPIGLAAQSAPSYDSPGHLLDRKHSNRIYIVERLTASQISDDQRDWIDKFRVFRQKQFAHSKTLMEAINPPYDFLMNSLVKNIAESA